LLEDDEAETTKGALRSVRSVSSDLYRPGPHPTLLRADRLARARSAPVEEVPKSSCDSCLSLRHRIKSGQGLGCAFSLDAAVPDHIRWCGPQTRGHRAAAVSVYEQECREFPRQYPKVAAAYARLAGELHDAERLAVGAFVVGFSLGVANVHLDPVQVCRRVAGDSLFDLEQDIYNFVSHRAVTHREGSFSPDDVIGQDSSRFFLSMQARAEAFLSEALQPLAVGAARLLKGLRRVVPDALEPLRLAGRAADAAAVARPVPGAVAALSPGAESREARLHVAQAAFLATAKADHERDVASIHLLRAAWSRQPRGAVQWHHMGQHAGIVCRVVTA